MTVFVVQQPRPFKDRNTGVSKLPDLTPALQYGALHFVLGPNDNPSLAPGQALIKARKALEWFSDDDFLLFANGDPAALLICSIVAARANHGRVKFLYWERASQRVSQGLSGFYMPCEVRYA